MEDAAGVQSGRKRGQGSGGGPSGQRPDGPRDQSGSRRECGLLLLDVIDPSERGSRGEWARSIGTRDSEILITRWPFAPEAMLATVTLRMQEYRASQGACALHRDEIDMRSFHPNG